MTTYVAVDSTTEAPARDGIVYPLAMTGIAQIAFLKTGEGFVRNSRRKQSWDPNW